MVTNPLSRHLPFSSKINIEWCVCSLVHTAALNTVAKMRNVTDDQWIGKIW